MRLVSFPSFDDLPAPARRLLERAGDGRFFNSVPWYDCFVAHALGQALEIRIVAVETDDPQVPVACLCPAWTRPRRGLRSPRTLSSLTNVDSVAWDLLIDPDWPDPRAAVETLIDGLCAREAGWECLTFRFLDRASPPFAWLTEALRRNGRAVQPFFQYANIYETITDRGSTAYIARRGSSIRQTLLRMERKAERSGRYRHVMHTGPEGLDRAIEDYERVFAASWKEGEPGMAFIQCLIRAAAEDGSLRLGLVYWDETPAAVQLSFVRGGRASMYKTAYDEAFKKHALGRLSLLHLMRHVIDRDRVSEVDFGIGAEPYKEEWLFQHRNLWGLVAYDPRTVRGALGALRHVVLPRLRRTLRPTPEDG